MESRLCCSCEAEIKGIVFYEGRKSLTPLTMSQVYFKKDSRNTFHSKAYFVQHYSGNQNILGHLPWKEAVVDDLFTILIPTVKLSG